MTRLPDRPPRNAKRRFPARKSAPFAKQINGANANSTGRLVQSVSRIGGRA